MIPLQKSIYFCTLFHFHQSRFLLDAFCTINSKSLSSRVSLCSLLGPLRRFPRSGRGCRRKARPRAVMWPAQDGRVPVVRLREPPVPRGAGSGGCGFLTAGSGLPSCSATLAAGRLRRGRPRLCRRGKCGASPPAGSGQFGLRGPGPPRGGGSRGAAVGAQPGTAVGAQPSAAVWDTRGYRSHSETLALHWAGPAAQPCCGTEPQLWAGEGRDGRWPPVISPTISRSSPSPAGFRQGVVTERVLLGACNDAGCTEHETPAWPKSYFYIRLKSWLQCCSQERNAWSPFPGK